MLRILTLLTVLTLGGAAMAQDKPNDDVAPLQPVVKTATFAGGCFWCMQPAFDGTPGVLSTRVGYTGGSVANPTYEQVSSGETGHVEAIEVTYNANIVKYETLLETYWENVDPTDPDGQFADKGSQYHTAIFVTDDAQRQAAEASKAAVEKKLAPARVYTVIAAAKPFYAAEDYHQKYYEKNTARYTMYKYGSGRVGKLEKVWGEKK